VIGLRRGRLFARCVVRREREIGTCELGKLVGLFWIGSGSKLFATSDGEEKGFGGGSCVEGLAGGAWSTLTSIRTVRHEWTVLE
jgi:hypothetical protein